MVRRARSEENHDDSGPDGLIETMRAEGGRIALIELHAARLRASARELGFRFDEVRWRTTVESVAEGADMLKVRSLLHRDGTMEVSTDLLEPEKTLWRAVLSPYRIMSDDRYRQYKTTRRHLYDSERLRILALGYDEVIFLNELGECAEGSRTNIILVKDGKWITPPTAAGALPGVFRRHLIETQGLKEGRVTPRDFETAAAVYLCNAVRGLIRAEISVAPEQPEEDVRST